MAFDYSKLRGRIVEKFDTQGEQFSLSLKLQGKLFFRQDEIERAINLLCIKPENIDKYFFAQNVQ